MAITLYDYKVERLQEQVTVMFRLKHTKEAETMSLTEFFEKLSGTYKNLLVCEETSGGRHFQGLITGPQITSNEVRETLKVISPKAKGNKCLYSKEVVLFKQAVKYNVKEGKYLYQGFPREFVLNMEKSSNKKENLKQKILDNEEQLLSGKYDFHTFGVKYIQIKVDHGQNLYNNHVQSYFNRMKVKSGFITASDYYENYFLDY